MCRRCVGNSLSCDGGQIWNLCLICSVLCVCGRAPAHRLAQSGNGYCQFYRRHWSAYLPFHCQSGEYICFIADIVYKANDKIVICVDSRDSWLKLHRCRVLILTMGNRKQLAIYVSFVRTVRIYMSGVRSRNGAGGAMLATSLN